MAITKATASSIAPAAKGDLVVGSATNDAAILGVGSNDQVLTADSSTTTGLKWATPASGSTFVGCALLKSTAQSFSNNTAAALTWDTESIDTNAFHSTSSNTSRITIPTGKAGAYQVNSQIAWAFNGTGNRFMYMKKNGNYVAGTEDTPVSYCVLSIDIILNLAVGDYIEVFGEQSSGGSLDVRGENYSPGYSFFQVAYLGAI
jgi:hypothetical protein